MKTWIEVREESKRVYNEYGEKINKLRGEYAQKENDLYQEATDIKDSFVKDNQSRITHHTQGLLLCSNRLFKIVIEFCENLFYLNEENFNHLKDIAIKIKGPDDVASINQLKDFLIKSHMVDLNKDDEDAVEPTFDVQSQKDFDRFLDRVFIVNKDSKAHSEELQKIYSNERYRFSNDLKIYDLKKELQEKINEIENERRKVMHDLKLEEEMAYDTRYDHLTSEEKTAELKSQDLQIEELEEEIKSLKKTIENINYEVN